MTKIFDHRRRKKILEMEKKIDQNHEEEEEEDSTNTWSTKVEGEVEGETSRVSTQDLSSSIPPSNEELM